MVATAGRLQRAIKYMLLLSLASLQLACATIGPESIHNGRLAYNRAITTTNNQQMLLTILNSRYEQNGNMLRVASVTANVRVAVSSSAQFGVGDNDNYSGNLVPFGAGIAYEENPTISYVPVNGAGYANQIMSPLPLTKLAGLSRNLAHPGYIYTSLIASINGIQNLSFLGEGERVDPRFARVIALLSSLTQARRLHWIMDPDSTSGLAILLDRSLPGHASMADELLALLGLAPPTTAGTRAVVPVALALDESALGGLGITTHSIWDLVEVLAAATEVAPQDEALGIAESYPTLGALASGLRIHRSAEAPQGAAVAVEYRDQWYYIADDDLTTKRFFRLLAALWDGAMADNSSGANAPVLTVPVSR